MSDTVRTRAELLDLFTDNNSQQISAQDMRDLIVTIFPVAPQNGFEVLVAASNAPAATRAAATYVCDGVADNVEIQAAIDGLPSTGGVVRLSAGTFYLAAGVLISSVVDSRSVNVQGQGHWATIVDVPNGITGFKFGNRATTGKATIGSSLSRMEVQGHGSGLGTCIGVDTDGIELCRFFDLQINDCDIGMVLRNLDRSYFETIRVGNPKLIGYKLVQAGTSVGGHNNWGTANFINCEYVLSENNSRGIVTAVEGNGTNPLARITWTASMLFTTLGVTGARGLHVEGIGVIASSFYNVIFENNPTHVETDVEAHLQFHGCEFLRSNSDSTRILKADAFGTFSFYDCAFQRATIAFEATAGNPRIYFMGGSKNDGNIGTLLSGSWGARLGLDTDFAGTDALALGTHDGNRMDYIFSNHVVAGDARLVDGITAPGTESGKAIVYVDTADGDLKVKFGDGVIKTLATDT